MVVLLKKIKFACKYENLNRLKLYSNLSCFKAYDVRGKIGVNIDSEIVYRVGRAVAKHFKSNKIIVGFDARETSNEFARQIAEGVTDAGADCLMIGLAGTEEMYWAVSEFNCCAGIEVTASHNPIDYNGLKIVKSNSKPLDDLLDFKVIKKLSEGRLGRISKKKGKLIDISVEARKRYVGKVLSFINVKKLKPFKVVVNCGNGAGGPTIDAIIHELYMAGVRIEPIRVNHPPDPTFPNGIPNPMLLENHAVTSQAVKSAGADIGLAFDGDFDRCFFFDGQGRFVPGEFIVALLASIFLRKEKGAKIVHDKRVIWNILDIVNQKGGEAVASKTGHSFIKSAMRKNNATYGGELSAHHYFRDFAFCDSGMIPWLLVLEFMSESGNKLEDWVDKRSKYFVSSGEKNFKVEDPDKSITNVLRKFQGSALLERDDGLSVEGSDWRFNLRMSNTEALVRLNVETKGDKGKLMSLEQKISDLLIK